MTLVLVWNNIEGIIVAADTRFGGAEKTVAEAGPKVFLVPITLNKWIDGHPDREKKRLPPMGFAFAGNTFTGQSTHAVAVACLNNLTTYELDDGPTVEDVAKLYARCAQIVVDERLKWEETLAHCFDAVIFGRSNAAAPSQAFTCEMSIENGKTVCEVIEVDVTKGALVALGSGVERFRQLMDEAQNSEEPIQVGELLQKIIDDPDVASVAGNQQLAIAAVDGVEIRPIIRSTWTDAPPELQRMGFGEKQQQIEYQFMGFDAFSIGSIGRYSATATQAMLR